MGSELGGCSRSRRDTGDQLDSLFADAPDTGCPVAVSLRQMAIRGRQKSSLAELTYSRISTSSTLSAVSSYSGFDLNRGV